MNEGVFTCHSAENNHPPPAPEFPGGVFVVCCSEAVQHDQNQAVIAPVVALRVESSNDLLGFWAEPML